MSWTGLFHLGDLALTTALGAGIAVWLLVVGDGRAALRWSMAFALALGLVGASKIAYLGWGTGMSSLHFKALSGHACGAAATLPTLAWLLTRRSPAAVRIGIHAAALALTVSVAVALVVARQHSAAEAVAGWLVGTCAHAVTVRTVRDSATRAGGAAAASALLALALCGGVIATLPVGYWMIRMARVLSGNSATYPWTPRVAFPTQNDRRQSCPDQPSLPSHGNGTANSTTDRCIRC